MKIAGCVLIVVAAAAVVVSAQDSFESTGIKLALKIYDDCSKTDGFSPCLKKKAITFLDRLGRMDKLSIAEGVTIKKSTETQPNQQPALTEEQLEVSLPRSIEAKDEALSDMLLDKVTGFVSSRTIEINLPKMSEFGLEEGKNRKPPKKNEFKKNIFLSGRGKKGGMKGMMGGMMMGIAAKMAAMIPLAIAGLFLLAGKALITAKIALLLSGIIAIKKLFASKQGGGGGHGHSSGGGGGWQSSGGGWDKRSLDETHKMAYKAYSPK